MVDSGKSQGQVICTNDGILLRRGPAAFLSEIKNHTSGSLSLLYTRSNELCIEWKPNDSFLIADADTQEQDDWSFVDTIAKRQRTVSECSAFSTTSDISQKQKEFSVTRGIHVRLDDLRHIEIHNTGHILRLIGRWDKKVHSEYFFQHGNADGFIRMLQTTHCLQRNRTNKFVFDVCIDQPVHDSEKLQKTFAELKIDDIKGTTGGGWISNMVRDPLAHTMDFFVKVSDVYISGTSSRTLSHNHRSLNKDNSHNTPAKENISFSSNKSDVLEENESSTNSSDVIEDYEVLGQSTWPKITPSTIVRGPTLSNKVWNQFKSENGRISDIHKVKEVIFRGGIDSSLRPEVWKYLLGYFDWNQSNSEIYEHRSLKIQEYFKMKLQWLSMSSIQERNFSEYRDRKCQIEKDVRRTDRTQEYFAGDDNPNLILLQDILMTYVMYNFDLGYVQGMSDLLAPILYVMENEADAFWCFVGFMDIVYINFDIDQTGMKRQLQDLQNLIKMIDPILYKHFVSQSAENMYFCFRWLLVWFKRELNENDVLQLWEILWTALPCPNFHLFISAAILEDQADLFIGQNYGFNEILKHVNEMSMKINLEKSLADAESIYLQTRDAKHLNDDVRAVIGIKEHPKASDSDFEDDFDEILIVKNPTEESRFQQKLDEACERSMHNSYY